MGNWLLVTTSSPGGSSTLRVWAWRRLRSLGAHYLQQSVCLLPATPETTRAVGRVLARLHEQGGNGQVLNITLTDARQEAAVIEAFQRERSDEYHEVVERTRQFHEELAHERGRGRATYTELEESDADLARHQRWLAGIRARDYFDAPGGQDAVEAVAACERALADFEAEAARVDARPPDQPPAQRKRRMGLTDKFKGLTDKAKDAAAGHKDHVHQAVQKAAQLADQRTGGQYHDQLAKAGAKADAYVDDLKPTEARLPSPSAADTPRPPEPPAE